MTAAPVVAAAISGLTPEQGRAPAGVFTVLADAGGAAVTSSGGAAAPAAAAGVGGGPAPQYFRNYNF